MTTDPPETRTKWSDMIAHARAVDADPTIAEREYPRFRERAIKEAGIDPDKVTLGQPLPPPERDPSNLNDPRLQRWVIAFAWLLVLVILGTCVAGGLCLTGAFQRCDCEESDG